MSAGLADPHPARKINMSVFRICHWMAIALALYPQLLDAQGGASPRAASVMDTTAAHITGVVQRYVDALMARDTEYIRAASMPTAVSLGLRSDAPPDDVAMGRTVDVVIADLARETRRMVGRVWSPRVTLTGRVALFTAPYAVWFDGKLSHCGIDHYIMAWSGSRWLVSQVIFTRETAGCAPPP